MKTIIYQREEPVHPAWESFHKLTCNGKRRNLDWVLYRAGWIAAAKYAVKMLKKGNFK